MAGANRDAAYLESNLYRIRHSAAHVMAQAVVELFPEASIAIGPPIQEGFYYDFDLAEPLTEADLERIEARMIELLKEDHQFERREVSADEAREIFKNQKYKLELINDILERGTDEYGEKLEEGQQPTLTVYQHSDFVDLCRGPHVNSTKKVKHTCVKLLRVAGAYWRGDETRPMLQRVYGTAWEKRKDLDQYLLRLEEAKKRDHRSLGKQLGLFSFSDAVGAGLPLWHPKGALVRYLAERFSQEAHLLNGYQWVCTPHIGRAGLWETSGHLDFYRDGMYRPMDIDGEEYFIKPMNCPFHIEIYKSTLHSYRDLPVRYAEFGTVYRYERSGVVSGLTRVRGFTQDDAHIFCTRDQAEEEILRALRFSLYVLRSFGLENFRAYVATKPESKYVGTDQDWDQAIHTLKNAVEKEGLPFEIDEGGGAFYGPKIDLKVTDFLQREWQLSTVQYDFNLPSRFQIEYRSADGGSDTPFMIHRALFGSFERFIAMLIEHYNGAFPLWLAPVQARLIPIADRHMEYCGEVVKRLNALGIRAEMDSSGERMQAKIRLAEIEKIPFALVAGDREAENAKIAVRSREEGDQGAMSVEEFFDSVEEKLKAGRPHKLED